MPRSFRRSNSSTLFYAPLTCVVEGVPADTANKAGPLQQRDEVLRVWGLEFRVWGLGFGV